jgi:hypothetical protein
MARSKELVLALLNIVLDGTYLSMDTRSNAALALMVLCDDQQAIAATRVQAEGTDAISRLLALCLPAATHDGYEQYETRCMQTYWYVNIIAVLSVACTQHSPVAVLSFVKS